MNFIIKLTLLACLALPASGMDLPAEQDETWLKVKEMWVERYPEVNETTGKFIILPEVKMLQDEPELKNWAN